MAVIRVRKSKNFTAMSNTHLRDPSLSLKAKGLLSVCLSLPDDWQYSVNGLTAISKEGRDALLTTLQELEAAGYVSRSQSRDKNGRMGKAEYFIYETPEENPQWEKPQTENPTTENPTTENPITEMPTSEEPAAENPGQLNTNLPNTERTKYEKKKEPCHRYGRYENVLLSDAEMEKLKAEFPGDYSQRIERLSEYMASTGKSYKSHLATIRSWSRRETPKKQGYSHEAYCFEEGESL